MDLNTWRTAAHDNLARLASEIQWLAPNMLYGTLSAAALLPVVTAANQGDFAALAALGSVVGAVGGNLVANQIQAWRDRSQAELASDLAARTAADPAWRDAVDAVLLALQAVPAVEDSLPADDKAWFADTLRAELARLGNLARYEATLSGRGAIGQGEAVVAAEQSIAARRLQGLAIAGSNNVVNLILRQFNATPGKPVADDVLRGHIERYLKWVGERYGAIELRGIERQGEQVIQLDLDTVYVPLAAVDFQTGGQRRDLDLNGILACGPRLVITGGPGSGKTTVLQHIAWTLTLAILQDEPNLAFKRLALSPERYSMLPLPIFVPLSAFALYRSTLPAAAPPHRRTLAAFISYYLVEKQSTLDLPGDFFTRLLHEGHAVILLLDGLDEVPNDAERAEVREAIQDLVLGKEGLRVVVTCRSLAYKDRTVLGRGFREVQVQALAAAHIDALVTQAYAAIHHNDVEAQQSKCRALLEGIESLEGARRRRLGDRTEPLVTSPLLVRLLLIVQENNRRLPDQRAELYMKATENLLYPDYLVDEAAAARLGRLIRDKETHLELVQYLAFQMHQRGERQGREIEEDQLKKVLEPSRYAELVPDLIRYTRLRGTLLDWRNESYRFLHLSFQEFLAARYLAEVVRGEGGIDGIATLLEGGPVLESWWREPALLVIGYLSKYSSPSNAQALVRRLAWVDEGAALRTRAPLADVQMAAATVAVTAFREWSPWQLGEAGLHADLAERLRQLLANRTVVDKARPSWRTTVGDTMARLGDPRPEVMTVDGMQFCYVPAGSFWMGDEKSQIRHDVNYDYWIGRYPVTNAQYAGFVQAGGYATARYWQEAQGAGYWRKDGSWKGPYDDAPRRGPVRIRDPFGLPNHPVVGVSWYEALAFCRWLSETMGREFRLPNEPEWEKAARGGEEILSEAIIKTLRDDLRPGDCARQPNPAPRRVYPWTNSSITGELANYDETGIGSTSAAGCFPAGASPIGAEEMAGSVWEWTRSLWSDGKKNFAYPYDARDGREKLDAGTDARRVLRGGSWNLSAGNARCAFRAHSGPRDWDDDLGFRLVTP